MTRFATSANVSLMYGELEYAERFAAAARDGFDHVEFWPGEDLQLSARLAADAGLSLGIVGVSPGEGHHGRMTHPDATHWWRNELIATVEYAKTHGCGYITLLAGNRQEGVSDREHREAMVANLEFAVGILEPGEGVTLLLEPLNSTDRPDHVLTTLPDAVALLEHVGSPSQVRILFDAYHLGHSGDDLAQLFASYSTWVSYIQVADAPGRHEPGSGAINYPKFFNQLDVSGYDGIVGFEFSPSASSADAIAATREMFGMPMPKTGSSA